jgi:type I restriction enzyme S subunit
VTRLSTSLWRLARFENGFPFKPDDFESTGTPVIRIRQLVDPDAEADLTERQVPRKYLLKDGDLVFSWSGSLAVRTWNRGPGWLNQHLFKVIPFPDVHQGWLRWTIEASIPQFLSMMHGSAMTHLTLDMLKQLQVDVPSLEEQRRIADFLDAETARIDLLVEARRLQMARLGEFWDSRLANAITEQANTYGWISLRRIITSVEQGWSPQCEEAIADPTEWAVLKTSAVSSGEFAPLEHKRLPVDIEPDPSLQVRDGDILMTRGSGSPDHVGMAALAKTDGRRLLLSDLLYRIRVRSSTSAEFVTSALHSKPVRGRMGLLFRGQSGQTIKLRVEDIRAIEIPNVPARLQTQIAAELAAEKKAINDARRSIEASISLLTERRQALITAAVTGRITA